MRLFVSLVCLVSLLLAAPGRAHAVEYGLQVANLLNGAFAYYIRGSVGHAVGELAMPDLERALDTGDINRGSLLYDRDIYPASDGVARSFGAVAVRPTGASTGEGRDVWKSVRWEGVPGQRVVLVVRPATMHRGQVAQLAINSTDGGLRYFLPYGVTLFPEPARVVAYRLPFVRSGEDGSPLWDRYLSRAVDLREGLAVVVGAASVFGDWVYIVVDEPPHPTTFQVVIGWRLRDINNDRVQPSGSPGSVLKK